MDKTIIIISLLPCIFMIHEFEEIIGMKAWLKRNEAWLSKKISVPYILWGMKFVLSSFPIMDIAVCFICGLLITALNLLLIHKLAVRFDAWLKRR